MSSSRSPKARSLLIALALADAGGDKLAGERGCIFIRNGMECPGDHIACGIPF